MKYKLEIKLLTEAENPPYNLLLLADPSRQQIDSYLDGGSCYIASVNDAITGVFVLKPLTLSVIEIKNIAVDENFRGQGIGKQLLHFASQISKESGYRELIIGTGNSSINQLALYQKAGFEIDKIIKDFFISNYEMPIFENGIQCKHMILLKKVL